MVSTQSNPKFYKYTIQLITGSTCHAHQIPKSSHTLPLYQRTSVVHTRTPINTRSIFSKRRVHLPLVNSTTLQGCVSTTIFPRRLNNVLVRYLTSAH